MNKITPIVRNLIILNVIIYVFTLFIKERNEIFYLYALNTSEGEFNPIQLLTCMFLHKDLIHVSLNMYTLFLFGTVLEYYINSQRFLLFYIITGVSASFISYCVYMYLGIQILAFGASGATSAVLVAFALLFPNVKFQLLMPPIVLKAKYLALLFVLIDVFGGIGYLGNTGIGHIAHLGGALVGFLLISVWKIHRQNF
jgi:membrane associated rhomboid family serine protease